jgi:hypothetical protein
MNMAARVTSTGAKHVIRTGEDPDNPGQLLQVMPWPVYQTMTDSDLRAIYEYLLAVPRFPQIPAARPANSPRAAPPAIPGV